MFGENTVGFKNWRVVQNTGKWGSGMKSEDTVKERGVKLRMQGR